MTKKNKLSTTVRSKFHYVIWVLILFFILSLMVTAFLATYIFSFNQENESLRDNQTSTQTQTLEFTENDVEDIEDILNDLDEVVIDPSN